MSDQYYFMNSFLEDHSPLSQDFVYYFQNQLANHHQFYNTTNNTNGSSSNPISGIPNTSNFEPLDVLSYGSSTNNIDVYDSEFKTLIDNNGGYGQVMDNFGTGGHLNNNLPQINHPLDSDALNFEQVEHIDFVVPEEGSSTIDASSVCMTKNRGLSLTPRPFKGKKRAHFPKGQQWTPQEDSVLIQQVNKYGTNKWSDIAKTLEGRVGKQCRERWHNHLRPNINKEDWSEAEERVLIQVHSNIGNKWTEIAKCLPGRTENSIKNHWNATKRKEHSRRKYPSRYQIKATVLQDYIRVLDSKTPKYEEKYTISTTPASDEAATSAMKLTPSTTTTTSSDEQLDVSDYFCSSIDHLLLPSFEFNNLDSLFDDIPPPTAAPVVNADENINIGLEEQSEMDNPLMDYEVDSELDLEQMMLAVWP